MLRVVLTGIFDQSGIQVDGCTASQSAHATLSPRSTSVHAYHCGPPCAAASVGMRPVTPCLRIVLGVIEGGNAFVTSRDPSQCTSDEVDVALPMLPRD